MSIPNYRGWQHREGDPEGVLRWHNGVAWTTKISGGKANDELTRLRAQRAAAAFPSRELILRIQALEEEIAAIGEGGFGSTPPAAPAPAPRPAAASAAAPRPAATPPRPSQPAARASSVPARGRRWGSRGLDAACYMITGIAAFFAAGSSTSPVVVVLVGLASIGYGVYIATTARSYWVTSLTYAIPFFAVAYLVFG